MNEELEYAEMLEIPVETVHVSHRERRRREEDLGEQVVEEVNERMEAQEDPTFAESTPITGGEGGNGRRDRLFRRILIGEFAAVCGLCAVIFLTNIFMTDSAINTFVRGLFTGNTTAADTRVYSDFALSPLVNSTVDTEIAVSNTGVLSFTAECSVYSPCDGEIASVGGNAEMGYSVEIRHSDSFYTVMSGLDVVYGAAGDEVRSNIPVGFTDGEGEVRVMFYSDGSLINACTVEGGALSWS